MLRHLIRYLAAQTDRIGVTAHRSQIEPLMRADIVNGHIASRRIHHAEFKERVGTDRCVAEGRVIAVAKFETSHFSLPFSRVRQVRTCCELSSSPSRAPRTIRGKFERCSKSR